MRASRKFQTILLTLLLSFFAIVNQTESVVLNQLNHAVKKQDVYDDFTVSDNSDYIDYSYEYDGFLDQVYIDCDLYHNPGTEIVLEGETYPEYGSLSFKTTFLFGELTFDTEFNYCNQRYYEDIICYPSSTGSLNAKLEYYNASNYDELETYYIDDYKDPEKLKKFILQIDDIEEIEPAGFFTGLIIGAIIALVVTYVIVAEIAEQNQAEINYEENKRLDGSEGVGLGCLIYNQHESSYNFHSPANYKFGFTNFDNAGCEVASVYNLLIMVDKAELLSDTIYKFEKWGLEYSIGWGYLGSNPKEIEHYLYHEDLKYIKVDCKDHSINNLGKAFHYFKQEVKKKKEAHLIVSAWNSPMTEGLHTYYIEKTNDKDEPYITYNWRSDYYYPLSIDSLDDLVLDGEKYIVGYIIYE